MSEASCSAAYSNMVKELEDPKVEKLVKDFLFVEKASRWGSIEYVVFAEGTTPQQKQEFRDRAVAELGVARIEERINLDRNPQLNGEGRGR